MLNTDSEFEYYCSFQPLRVQIELTDCCNLNCAFCYQAPQTRHSEKWRQIIQTLAEQEVVELVLTGGEPTLHPDFRQIFKYAASFPSDLCLQTNGSLIDESLVEFMAANNLFAVNVSVHGSEEFHNEIVGSKDNAYQHSLSAIRALLKHPKIGVSVNIVATSRTQPILGEHLEEMYQMGVRHFTATRFVPTGIGKCETSLIISREQMAVLLSSFDKFMKRHPDCSFMMAGAVPECSVPQELIHMVNGCGYGINRFYVDIDGNLLHCGMLREKLGNVLDNSLTEIKRRSSVYRLLATNQALPTKCRRCMKLTCCHGGCRAAAFAYSGGNICAADPFIEVVNL